METQEGERLSTDSVRPPPPLHHHHHRQILPCHHHHHNHNHHHHIVRCCAVHGFVLPPNGPPILHPTPQTSSHLHQQIQPSQTFQQEDVYQELEEEEDDPIFVLTDEWRDFFAKSEAKRREAKKQAQKQGNR